MTAPRSTIAHTAITLGVVGSLAGNVTWAWDRSPVLVGVGILMSLVLPVAVRLWKATDGVTGWARTERVAVMSFICGGAALYTLIHSSLLLRDLGLPAVIAWIPGAVMEALVVQAARAGAPQVKPVSRPVTPTKTQRRAPVTAPVTAPVAVPDAPPSDESPEDRNRRLARERKARSRARTRQEAA